MSYDAWLAQVQAANARGETLVDLDAVATWMQQQTPLWEARGFAVEQFPVTRDVPKNSVRMNVDGPDFVSTTIVWDSGEWEIGIGRVTDEHTQTSDYDPGSSTDEVLAKVAQALTAVGIIAM
jgi:hypothetical protein